MSKTQRIKQVNEILSKTHWEFLEITSSGRTLVDKWQNRKYKIPIEFLESILDYFSDPAGDTKTEVQYMAKANYAMYMVRGFNYGGRI